MLIYVFVVLQIIGVIAFFILSLWKMFSEHMEKGTGKRGEIRERIRRYIVICEIVLAIMELIYVYNAPNLPIIEGTSIAAVHSFGNERFYLAYRTSGRSYGHSVVMDETAIQNIQIECECQEGSVYVKFTQGTEEKVIDVTSYDGTITLETFAPGDVRISTYNENARDVKLEIKWEQAN